MAVEQVLWPDDTPFTGIPIPNFEGGLVSDITTVRVFNDRNDPGSGSVLRNNFMQLAALNPSVPTEMIQSGIAPLDQLWGEIRFVDYSSNIDPYVTDWFRVGNTSVLPFPTMIADSFRTFELRFRPPSYAKTNPYTFLTLVHTSETAVGIPGPGIDIHRGVITGFGDHRQTVFVNDGRVTASPLPDDVINVDAGAMIYQGTEIIFIAEPQTIDQFDGNSEELEIGEAYILEVTRDSLGSIVINKGFRDVTPLPPARPLDELFESSIRVDFVGVATPPIIDDSDITNTEVYGQHYTRVLSGLTIRIYGGAVLSSGTWRPVQGSVDFVLTPSTTNYLWSRADGTFSITLDASLPDTSSDLLYQYDTDATDVTLIDDMRKLIDEIPKQDENNPYAAMAFSNPGGGGGPHIDITVEGVFVGWTDATLLVEVGGIVSNPADLTSASFTVPYDGWYETSVLVNGSAVGTNDRIIGKFHVNDVGTPGQVEYDVDNNFVNVISSHNLIILNAGDEIDVRFTNDVGDVTSSITLHSFVFTIELKVRT